MLKFLHIADVHLNKSFATKDESLRVKLQRRLKKSFKNAIAYCVEHQLNGLIIAGDLFDTHVVSYKDRLFVLECFEILEKHDIHVYYASGNHDYTSFNSDLRKMKFPENVHTFFNDEYQIYEMIDPDTKKIIKIVGCGHMMQHETRDLIEKFPNDIEIGIAHSMVASRLTKGDEGQYLPSSIETIKSKNIQYFALGHVHSGGAINKDENIYYSGVLQGLNRNELGPKGGNLLILNDQNITVEPVVLSALNYDTIDVSVDNFDSIDTLYENLNQILIERYEQKDPDEYILSVNLKGRTSLFNRLKDENELLSLSELLLERIDLVDISVKNMSQSCYDAADYKNKKSVLGAVLNYLDEMNEKTLPEMTYLSKDKEKLKAFIKNQAVDQILDYFLEGHDED